MYKVFSVLLRKFHRRHIKTQIKPGPQSDTTLVKVLNDRLTWDNIRFEFASLMGKKKDSQD